MGRMNGMNKKKISNSKLQMGRVFLLSIFSHLQSLPSSTAEQEPLWHGRFRIDPWEYFLFFPLLPLSSMLLHKSLIPLTRTTCPGSLLESSGIRSGSLVNNSNCAEKVELWQVGTNSVREDEKKGVDGWGGWWKIDLKNPEVYTRRRVQSGAELSVSYVTSFTRTCEGQTRGVDVCFLDGELSFYFLKMIIQKNLCSLGKQKHRHACHISLQHLGCAYLTLLYVRPPVMTLLLVKSTLVSRCAYACEIVCRIFFIFLKEYGEHCLFFSLLSEAHFEWDSPFIFCKNTPAAVGSCLCKHRRLMGGNEPGKALGNLRQFLHPSHREFWSKSWKLHQREIRQKVSSDWPPKNVL